MLELGPKVHTRQAAPTPVQFGDGWIQVADVCGQGEARASFVHVNIISSTTIFFAAADGRDEGEHWQGQITCERKGILWISVSLQLLFHCIRLRERVRNKERMRAKRGADSGFGAKKSGKIWVDGRAAAN